MRISDWSSDVRSSDLPTIAVAVSASYTVAAMGSPASDEDEPSGPSPATTRRSRPPSDRMALALVKRLSHCNREPWMRGDLRQADWRASNRIVHARNPDEFFAEQRYQARKSTRLN